MYIATLNRLNMFTLSRPSVPYSLSFRHSSSHFCRSTNCKIKVQTSGQARTTFAGCHPAARRLLPPPMSSRTDPLPSPIPPNDVSNIITETLFEEMLPHRNNPRCPGIGFYTYDAFVAAARRFPGFGTTGNIETRKRELAAFFAQTSHETSGGWKDITGDEFARGYCHIREIDPPSDYCRPSEKWPCISGQRYYGRGPIQLTHNFNYGAAGEALGLDLLSNPDLVATNAALSFEAAIWFWMTPQYEKPSCHDVIIGVWTPTEADIAANRLPGYGLITNIINGGECGRGVDKRVARRIGFFERYCGMLGVSTGDNLDCYNQCSF